MADNPILNILESIQALSNQLTFQSDHIATLIEKVGALEVVQLRLFSALAETNPSVHAKVVEELANLLEMKKSVGIYSEAYDDHLRALTGIKAESKPLLRLVPKKSEQNNAE
ncbi:hypothetical protein [Geotalea sp. SG265]|uniref:hypothetical protein n=1 Tax=Geotalea sp. SG265 TaxID=2922867 RepID=UPI001FAF994C|nr:hypothetical protein [Geotalea sp. SG265]